MGIPFTKVDDKAIQALDEVERAAQQAQITLAAIVEVLTTINRGVEDFTTVIAKLKAALK